MAPSNPSSPRNLDEIIDHAINNPQILSDLDTMINKEI